MVSPTPLLERRPKNRALATAFGQNGRPGHGRRANQTGSAVAGRRLASRRAVRPSRAAWATVAASRGPSGARRSSRSGEPPRFGAGARGGVRNRPSRRAVPTSFGWPCAHGLTAPPPRGTPRSEIIRSKRYALRPSGAARSPPRLCNFRASSTSAVDPAPAQVRKKHHKTPHAPRAKCFQTKGGAFGQFVRKHAVPET